MGLEKATMDHHQTGGVSVTSLARNQQHDHAFVESTAHHKNMSTTMLQSTPCDRRSHGEDQREADVSEGVGQTMRLIKQVSMTTEGSETHHT